MHPEPGPNLHGEGSELHSIEGLDLDADFISQINKVLDLAGARTIVPGSTETPLVQTVTLDPASRAGLAKATRLRQGRDIGRR